MPSEVLLERTGISGHWVTGPLQLVRILGEERGDRWRWPQFVACLYWRNLEEPLFGPRWIDVELVQIASWGEPHRVLREPGERPLFTSRSGTPTRDLHAAEVYAYGHVKHDGCTQVLLRRSIHADSREQLEAIFAVLRETRALCARRMASTSMIRGEYDLSSETWRKI